MEIKDMKMEDIDARISEIRGLVDTPDADLNALTEEVDQLQQRKAEIIKDAEERKALKAKVIEDGKTIRTFEKETPKMEEKRFGIDSIESRTAWVKSLRKSRPSSTSALGTIRNGLRTLTPMRKGRTTSCRYSSDAR